MQYLNYLFLIAFLCSCHKKVIHKPEAISVDFLNQCAAFAAIDFQQGFIRDTVSLILNNNDTIFKHLIISSGMEHANLSMSLHTDSLNPQFMTLKYVHAAYKKECQILKNLIWIDNSISFSFIINDKILKLYMDTSVYKYIGVMYDQERKEAYLRASNDCSFFFYK